LLWFAAKKKGKKENTAIKKRLRRKIRKRSAVPVGVVALFRLSEPCLSGKEEKTTCRNSMAGSINESTFLG